MHGDGRVMMVLAHTSEVDCNCIRIRCPLKNKKSRLEIVSSNHILAKRVVRFQEMWISRNQALHTENDNK